MMLWLIIGAVVVMLLVAAYFTDRKSRRVRGHAGRVRGGMLSRRLDAIAGANLNQFDGGASMNKLLDPHAGD